MEVSAPLEGDCNQGPVILAFIWTFTSLALMVFCLRLWTKIRITHNAGLDDAITAFSLICAINCSGMMIAAVDSGLGRHPYYLQPAAISKAVKLSLILEPFGIIAFSLPKIAVAMTLTQIMPPSKRKAWFLCCLTASQTVSAVIACIMLFVHCSPTRALWTPEISADASYWPPSVIVNYTTFVGAYSAAVDLVLAAFPISIFWNLRIDRKTKIGLCMLMGLTVLSSICAIVKSSYLETGLKNPSNFTWDSVPLFIWSMIEADTIIIAVSTPNLKPLVSTIRRVAATGLGTKRKTTDIQTEEDHAPLRTKNHEAHQQHGNSGSRSYSMAIPMQDQILKATELQVEYEQAK